MTFKFYFCAALAVSSIAATAMAGPRIEARAGFDSVGLHVDYDDGVDAFEEDGSESGIAYGAEAGYDHWFGDKFVGAYASIDFSTVDVCAEDPDVGSGCLEADHSIGLGGRFGVGGPESLRFYAKLGYVIGQLSVNTTDGIDTFEESEDRGGLQAGAGLEYPLGTNAYVKAEYIYSDFEDSEYDFGSFGFDRHQIMGGVGFAF